MSLVEQRQGLPMVMDEIPRTYYPGRGFLTDQEAYPENPFYRTPRYSGGVYNNAFQNFNGQQLFTQMLPPIDPAAHRNQMRQKKIYDKGKGTDNPFEAETFLRRTGPQLPLAAIPPMGFQNKFVS